MRVRSLRWLVVFGIAAIAFGAIGYSVSHAQVAEPIPEAELSPAAEQTRPPEWDGSGEHPGKADFDQYCRLCHALSDRQLTGPGLLGVGQRVADAPAHQGMSVEQRLLEFIKTTRQGGEENYSPDTYFKSVQESVAGPGVQMSDRGGLPEGMTDRQILNIIDYFLRYRDIEFDEAQYLREVKMGKALVSGEAPFHWGGPACAGCHTVGPDRSMMGANIGPNIGHTYVLMRERGKDEKSNFTDGLKDILSGENAPKAHHYYKDVEGSSPLTDAELNVVATFFEQTARETGTEHDSNYLPIFALLFAALCIVALEPGIVNILFAKEHGEYIDGPYKEDEHGHGDHDEGHDDASEDKPEEKAEDTAEEKKEEPKSEEAPKEEAKSEEPKSEEKPAEEEVKEEPKAEEEKPAEEGAEAAAEEPKPESKDTEYSPRPEEAKAEDAPAEEPTADEAADEAAEEAAEEAADEAAKSEEPKGEAETDDNEDDKNEDDKKEDS